jgi:hypothetical protein
VESLRNEALSLDLPLVKPAESTSSSHPPAAQSSRAAFAPPAALVAGGRPTPRNRSRFSC